MSELAQGYEYATVGGGVRIERCLARKKRLVVPQDIAGLPVVEIAPYAFQANNEVESIVLPAHVTAIGSRAFASCPHLKTISFPAGLKSFDNSWVAGCTQLADIVLPGSIVDLQLVSPAPLGVKRILIGANTKAVHLSRTWKRRLERVDVSCESRWLSSDGTCIYSADGTELVAHATRCSHVVIMSGCVRIGPRAFEHEQHLECVELPESVREVGECAFAESGLRAFSAPSGLRKIDAYAFAECHALERVELGSSLEELQARAFDDCTVLESVLLPASVLRVGRKAFEGTSLQPCGETPSLAVDADNPVLFIDMSGVLCERGAAGIVVREALDLRVRHYRAPDGTVCIAERAFAGHPHLERLEICEGVERIEAEAFMGCEQLKSVELPASLNRICDRAFATTGLRSCTVPAAVEHLGECALAFNFKNWHPTTNPPHARAHIVLEEGNARYFVDGGLMYEHLGGDCLRVVLYVGPEIDIAVKPDATSIAPYAFFGVQGIRELRLPAHIQTGEATFAMRKPPERIIIEGVEGIDFATMHDWRGVCALQRSFAGDGTTNAKLLCTTFDEEAAVAQLDYDVFCYMLGRLVQPDYLSPENRSAFERVFSEHLGQACTAFAQHNARERIDQLADAGFITTSTIAVAIEAASAARSAPIVARLHELKRTRFSAGMLDFDL